MNEMKEFSKLSLGFYNSYFSTYILRDFPDPLPFNPFYKTGFAGKDPPIPPHPTSNMEDLENFKIATKGDDGKFSPGKGEPERDFQF